jgi:hypothetical protein
VFVVVYVEKESTLVESRKKTDSHHGVHLMVLVCPPHRQLTDEREEYGVLRKFCWQENGMIF